MSAVCYDCGMIRKGFEQDAIVAGWKRFTTFDFTDDFMLLCPECIDDLYKEQSLEEVKP